MYDVISIGSATLDIFVKSPEFKVIPTDLVPEGVVLCEAYGAKIDVDTLHMLSGGGGSNTAASFIKKGLKTGLIAEIGQDIPASAVLADLKNHHINTDLLIQEPDEQTATSVILVSPEGGRSIVTSRGASRMLEINDIPWQKLQTNWIYISSLGGQPDLLEALILHSHEHNIKVAVNPGSGELNHRQKLRSLLDKITVLILNKEEFCNLMDNQIFTDDSHMLNIAKQLPTPIIAITNGNQGAYIIDQEIIYYAPSSPKPVVEATGAGDAFGSGLVSGLIMNWNITDAIKLAAANAEGVINHFGAKQGLISLDDYHQQPAATVMKM